MPNKVHSKEIVFRFIKNQDIDFDKLKLKKVVFYDSRNPLQCSCALIAHTNEKELKRIAQTNDSVNSYFVGFSETEAENFQKKGFRIDPSFHEYHGHVDVIYDTTNLVEDDKPLPNIIKQTWASIQRNSIFLIDNNPSSEEFNYYKLRIDPNQEGNKKLIRVT